MTGDGALAGAWTVASTLVFASLAVPHPGRNEFNFGLPAPLTDEPLVMNGFLLSPPEFPGFPD